MKVLIVAWNMYDDKLKEYNRNCTREIQVIRNLCGFIGRKEELYFFVSRFSMPPMKIDNIIGTELVAGIGAFVSTNAQHMEAMIGSF